MQADERSEASRGFFTLAQNTEETDYIRMAYGLALSLRASQSKVSALSIGITPGTTVPARYRHAFDQVIEIPWGDHAAASSWKLENEWKVLHMSPYDETVKLDADMLFFNDIGTWWDQMSMDDFCIANKVLNYRGAAVTSDYYRKVFTQNALPNVYTAFTYFKKTDAVYELFELIKYIYFNHDSFFEHNLLPEHRPRFASTDVIFALALKILDLEQVHHTARDWPTFTHMKSQLQGWQHMGSEEDWTKAMVTFFNPELECKIGNYLQYFPLHYHLKHWLTEEILGYYERRL
jgi:hypothetical protein